MNRTHYYIVNAITLYRLLATLVLAVCLAKQALPAFRWLLAISFFTDALDGWLARRLKVTSDRGARLDSIADDATVLVAIIGILVFQPDFVWEELPLFFILIGLYLLQLLVAMIVYGRPTSFHTYAAKVATVAQGGFLIIFFFSDEWPVTLFHVAAALTAYDLLEELVLVALLPSWRANVKGFWWVLKRKHSTISSP
ncbi:CDP-alcohol phosphatidyltransferase family protein [Flavisolibacter nicotianae]|uniref:CDP-alcohol phosphatidyltransferase family protein n=1 Tax=Flavisolibacter nicotianae TaxID=2364882 RepID=UPI000EB41ADA|nr:CDP-alcohol phosphatidyltransferase family protein [Flavisolibacter nicotianae]